MLQVRLQINCIVVPVVGVHFYRTTPVTAAHSSVNQKKVPTLFKVQGQIQNLHLDFMEI